jgi:hypothetical protein
VSGEGFIAAAQPVRQRSRASIKVTAAIVNERAGVLAHARSFCAALERHQRRGRYGAAEAADIRRSILNFANDIAIGLHVDGDDGDDGGVVRAAMREKIKGMENAPEKDRG